MLVPGTVTHSGTSKTEWLKFVTAVTASSEKEVNLNFGEEETKDFFTLFNSV